MKLRCEIHGLDYAVCLLMAGLDQIFANRVEGWKRSRYGINFEIVRSQREGNDLHLRVCPAGYPVYVVNCRFDNHQGVWNIWEGSFGSDYPVEELRLLRFKGENSTNLECMINSDDDRFREIIARERDYGCS